MFIVVFVSNSVFGEGEYCVYANPTNNRPDSVMVLNGARYQPVLIIETSKNIGGIIREIRALGAHCDNFSVSGILPSNIVKVTEIIANKICTVAESDKTFKFTTRELSLPQREDEVGISVSL